MIKNVDLTRMTTHGFDASRWQEEADRIAKEHCDFSSPICHRSLSLAITDLLVAERERIERRLRESIPRILAEGNPSTTVGWIFDSPAEGINEKNVQNFVAEVLVAVKCKREPTVKPKEQK